MGARGEHGEEVASRRAREVESDSPKRGQEVVLDLGIDQHVPAQHRVKEEQEERVEPPSERGSPHPVHVILVPARSESERGSVRACVRGREREQRRAHRN